MEESLRQHMAQYDPTPSDADIEAEGHDGGERTGGWQVTDAGSADWALRRIAGATSAKVEAQRLAEQQIAQVQAWLKGEQERADRTIHWFEGRLHDYHLQRLSEDPKAKTIRLPHGTLQMRAAPTQYLHDELTVDTCRSLGLPVKVVEAPEWGEIKKRLSLVGDVDARDDTYTVIDTETGAVVEGVRAKTPPDTFSAKPAVPKGGDE